jgi:hypothetical protein
MAGRVGNYIQARVRAFADNVNDLANTIQTDTLIGATVQLLASGFGLDQNTPLGQRFAKRREDARKQLTGI